MVHEARHSPMCMFSTRTLRSTNWAVKATQMWTRAFESLTFKQKTVFSHGYLDAYGGFSVRMDRYWLRPSYKVKILADF